MKNPNENPIDLTAICGSCKTHTCGSCGSLINAVDPLPQVSRRNFGKTLLAGTAAAFFGGVDARAGNQSSRMIVDSHLRAGNVSPELAVSQKDGPILTVLDEFYKMGPGPSSSHTMGPMRITYDFYQRVSKLPTDELKRATALKVHLYGSLSATGEGHGTNRASLAGILGKSPADCPPEFLDGLAAEPNKVYKLSIGPASFDVSLKDVIFDKPDGTFPHPNTMTCKLMAGDTAIYELEYYSVGGGFIEWKGYKAPDKGQPKYPYEHAKELKKYLIDDKIPLPKLLLENEMAISGKSEQEIWEFIDQVTEVMVRGVDAGLKVDGVLPGPIKLESKAAEMYSNIQKGNKGPAGRAVATIAAYGFAMAEENARGHIIVTAPTGGSAGIIPAIVKSLRDVNTPTQSVREGMLAAAAIGYLCKHNATLSGAEGGCQAEVGVGSSMGAALISQAMGEGPKVVSNAAESALEHHLGMTCDPVAGYVQIPCIERCAYGAVKAWTAYTIASEEVPEERRVDLDTTISAMALTAKEMNTKYKETSEGGLAVSVVLC